MLIEDSAFMRIIISDYLRKDPMIELVGTASNGKEGFEKTNLLRPDVVISDMVMPEFDGLYAVKEIMKYCPTPIVLLSSLEKTNPMIFEALNAGAVDFFDKPKGNIKDTLDGGGYQLSDLVKSVAEVDEHVLGSISTTEINHSHTFDTISYEVVVIGASTGGPGVTESIIKRLPANLAVPVVIAQHMPERFLISYAERLNNLTPLTVKVPLNGEELQPYTIYIAPGNKNTRVTKRKHSNRAAIALTEDTYDEYNFPSVDCLFLSAAEAFGKKVIGLILTGMGRDGTVGLKKIKEAGGITIVQDEASSIIYGMPKSAWESGAASHQVKLKDIPGFIVSCL